MAIPVSSHLHRNEHGVLWMVVFIGWWRSSTETMKMKETFVITSFNVAVMMIQKTPLPLELSSGSYMVKLGAFREWLCITILASPPRCEEAYNEFWVMKEYGVMESITLRFLDRISRFNGVWRKVSSAQFRWWRSGKLSRGIYQLAVKNWQSW